MIGAWLDTTSPVFTPDPIAKHHSLNEGRAAWWLSLNGIDGGARYYDLLGRDPGLLSGFGAGFGWRGPTRPGALGPELWHDGASTLVTPASSRVYATTTAPFSVAFWVYINDLTTQTFPCPVVLKSDGTDALRVFITNQAGYLGLCTGSNTTFGRFQQGASSGYVGGWNRCVVAFDGVLLLNSSSYGHYVNGQPLSMIGASPFGSGPTATAIGYAGSAQTHLYGRVDDVSVWSRKLSAAEAIADYELSRRGYPGVLNRWRPTVSTFTFSSSSFSFSPSGSIKVGGSALPPSVAFSPTPAGVLILGGSANPPSATFSPTPSGVLLLGGSATRTITFSATASGSIVLGGSASLASNSTFSYSPSGGVAIGGSAIPPGVAFSPSPSGSIVVSGSTVAPSLVFSVVPSGSLKLGGQSAISFSTSYGPSGGLTLGGTAFVSSSSASSPIRDRDVYLAIKGLLESTGEFSEVFLGRKPGRTKSSAEQASVAFIQPGTARTSQDGSVDREYRVCPYLLTVRLRVDDRGDEAAYTELLDRADAVVRNTLMSRDNRNYGGYCISHETKLSDSTHDLDSRPDIKADFRGSFSYVTRMAVGYSVEEAAP